MGAIKLRHHLFEPDTHVTIVREGVLHVEIGQSRFFGETLWRQEISDSITRDGRDLDVAFAGQTLQIEIGQTKRNTKFGRKSALSGPAISIELAQEQKVSLAL